MNSHENIERGRGRVVRVASGVLLALLGFVVCFPLALLVVGSIAEPAALAESLGGVVSGEEYARLDTALLSPSLQSYVATLFDSPAFHVLMTNSAFYAVAVLTGQVLVGAPAAWALARFRFRGRNALFFLYVLLMVLPFQAVMLPNYLVLRELGVDNTVFAIVLPGIFSAFPVFVMRQFFAAIPDNIIESARLDGAGEWRIFLRIGVPLGAPGVFAALMLGFFEYWGLVEQPIAFLRDQALWPISLFAPTLTLENAGTVFAAAVVAAVPSVLLFLLGGDYLAQGIAATTRGDDGK